MDLIFKSKTGGLQADQITILLSSFLIKNPIYIGLTFSILSRRTNIDKNIKIRIESSPEIDTVEEHKDLGEYYNLMNSFYDTITEKLNIRRGKLLELLVSKIQPINTKSDYEIILESLVEYKGSKITDKDIDVVFKYNEIELIECKANLSSYLYPRPPEKINKKNKKKLKFMMDVKTLAFQSDIKCHLFFATYGQDEELCKDILTSNGFQSFSIINRKRIKNSLLSYDL